MAATVVKLLLIQGKPAGKSLGFPRGDYFIGRGPECHIRPDSDWVSRQHCLLRVTGDAVFIRDLGSRNGTLVNGLLVETEQRLMSGDQVQVGPLVFEVHMEGQLAAAPPVGGTTTVNQHADETAEIDPKAPRDLPQEDEHVEAKRGYERSEERRVGKECRSRGAPRP